jgi:2-oxoglutarate ferredoxin oxidoreductase subunit alpha
MEKIDHVVIRFSGDSGDGMQLTGNQFTNTSALMGNDTATFPDFPAEIRAPQGTVAGVSGFQVQFGSIDINTPGDSPDILVAMNPAAVKANLASMEKGKVIILDVDTFTELNFKKAGFTGNPLEDGTLDDFQVLKVPITSLTMEALKDLDLDKKSKARCKNFFALGMTYFFYTRDLKPTVEWINQKFGKKPVLAEANVIALKSGSNYCENTHSSISTYEVPPAKIAPGKYRQISGNEATALGFVQGAQSAGLDLYLGSYPITPASDILHELSNYKDFGVKTVQCEDEIAAVCSAIGASFGGALAMTTTSGPGLALKGEAAGLAMMYEIPLVIVDVQRGGPSTGLPTKTEQSDLNIAMFGRNGDSPMIVVAASRPSDCFHMAYEACRLTLEHMTPVVLLTDGYIANGAEPWKIPDVAKDYPKITPRFADPKDYEGDKQYLAFARDDEKLARTWAIPGTPGLEHRIGGLETEVDTGNVSYMPGNHETMVNIRAEKVKKVANFIPKQEVEGEQTGDLLIISWGGTYGATHSAVIEAQNQGKKVSLAHIKYLSPFPKNLEKVISSFKKVIVCELNKGQLRNVIRSEFGIDALGYNKVQGLPFKISELVGVINKTLES